MGEFGRIQGQDKHDHAQANDQQTAIIFYRPFLQADKPFCEIEVTERNPNAVFPI
jgi:hypothetical protein